MRFSPRGGRTRRLRRVCFCSLFLGACRCRNENCCCCCGSSGLFNACSCIRSSLRREKKQNIHARIRRFLFLLCFPFFSRCSLRSSRFGPVSVLCRLRRSLLFSLSF